MAAMCPCRGVRLIRDLRSGRGGKTSVALNGARGDMVAESNMSPSTKAAGNDSGLLRKSSWPKSQKALKDVLSIAGTV